MEICKRFLVGKRDLFEADLHVDNNHEDGNRLETLAILKAGQIIAGH